MTIQEMPKEGEYGNNKWGHLNAILAAALFGGCVAFEKMALGEVHLLCTMLQEASLKNPGIPTAQTLWRCITP